MNLAELVKANHYCAVAHYADCLDYFLKEYKNTQSSYAAFMIGKCSNILGQLVDRLKYKLY